MSPFDSIVILSLLLLLSAILQTQSQNYSANHTDTNRNGDESSKGTFNLGQLLPEPVDIELDNDEISAFSIAERSRIPGQGAVARHPFTVALLIQRPGSANRASTNSYRVCSGSLLSAGWVMSSARCLGGCGRCKPVVYMCAGLSVVRTEYAERPEGAQCRKAVNAYVHPKYRSRAKSGDYDVAICKANTLFSLKTKLVQAVKLSIKNFIQKKIEKCVLTGFTKGHNESEYDMKVQNVEVKKPCNDDFKLSTLLDEADDALNEQKDEPGVEQSAEQEQDFKKESGLDRHMCSEPQKGPGSGLSATMVGGALVCAGELKGIASCMMQYNTGDSKKPVRPFTCTSNCDDVPKMTVFQDLCPHLRWINSVAKLFNSDDIPPECRGAAARSYCATDQMLFLFILGLALRFIW